MENQNNINSQESTVETKHKGGSVWPIVIFIVVLIVALVAAKYIF